MAAKYTSKVLSKIRREKLRKEFPLPLYAHTIALSHYLQSETIRFEQLRELRNLSKP